MPKKLLLIPTVLVAALALLVGGVYAYDTSRPERIAEGVRVGGVSLGGLAPREARAVLQERFTAAIERPIVVNHDRSTWTLGPREARVRANVAQMVREATRRSDDGGMLGRTVRRLGGGDLDLDLQPQVTFSDRAVVRLIDKVRDGVERPARDAKLELTAAGVKSAPGQRGLKVRASELHDQINAALVSPSAERRFVARTRKVKPKVTRAQLAKKNPVVLIADRATFKLKVYKGLKLARTYPIAVGKAGNDTPPGLYDIANKAVNPAWSVPNSDWAGSLAGQVIPGGAANNPIRARWLGIADGVGIHGTTERASIGSNASHGCLRMLVEDVIELYGQVPVGAPILIA